MKLRQSFLIQLFAATLVVLSFARPAQAQSADEENPFTLTPSVTASNGTTSLSVAFHVPAHHHIYADKVSFELNNAKVSPTLPVARQILDKFSKSQRFVFEHDFVVSYPLNHFQSATTLAVTFQGCNEEECYFPETRQWKIGADLAVASLDDPATATTPSSSGELSRGFQVAARASGFMGSDKFLHFLDQSKSGAPASKDLFSNLAGLGVFATLGLILLGGLALNLTPCVLPMIPINLAILGAGAQNQNRRRSFLLGATYGGGMALAYGSLGFAVVLTGSKFGLINSTAWFNFSIAVVFVLLGLAMFDKLAIDFSRFQRSGGSSNSSRGAFLAAGVMGGVSALLAGACVAPVVISVLLLSATFYQKGNLLGLSLPFVLGLGMAIPWPFAAAGLSFLPKPGAWMTRVKCAFGVFIFGFAAWYGWIGWNLSTLGHGGALNVAAKSSDNSVQQLMAALEQSRATGRPVVVDFWAGWCKNCEAMEHSTFHDANVRTRLNKDYILVKFQVERLNDAALKPVLDEFGVMGLPTCVVLSPGSSDGRSAEAYLTLKD